MTQGRREDDDDLDVGDMRSVFASMRETDEEPPGNGMAALMAAARAKADEMRPQPSFFERVAAAFRRPAVLAFASVALLATGAVVVVRQGGGESKMTASSPESAKLDEANEAPGSPPPVVADEARVEAKREMTATAPAPMPATPPTIEKAPEPKPKTPRPAVEKQKIAAKDPVVVAEPTKAAGEGFAQAAPPVESPPADPAPAATRGMSRGTTMELAGTPDSATDDMALQQQSVASIVKQAKELARAGDCKEVKRLSELVAKRDAVAFKRVFSDGKLMRECLEIQQKQ